MYKLLFPLTLLIFVSITPQLSGQKRTYSPTSRFGIGELYQSGTGQSAGMGQTGIATGSQNYLNNLNPASYTSMDSMSFYFEGGLHGFGQNLADRTVTSNFSNIVFDYFTIGFPISKRVYTSIGLTPFSQTGYNIIEGSDGSDLSSAASLAMGNGNISKVYWGLGFKPTKNLSVGFNYSYLFGNLKNLNYITFTQDAGSLMYGRISEMHISDWYYNLGLQYKIDLEKSQSLVFGATLAPSQKIKNEYTSFTGQGVGVISGTDLIMTGDTIEHIPTQTSEFEIPMSLGIGLAYNIEDKLTLAVDYKTQNWSKTTLPYSANLKKLDRLSFGGEYIPNDRSARKYYQRLRYRIGGYYQNDYVQVLGNDQIDFGMSFGLGMPIKRSRSSFNLGFEVGQKGDLANNGIKESYYRFMINFSLHEYWFIKQKFD